MTNAVARDVSFLQGFQEFYSEVIRLRRRAELRFDHSPELEGEPPEGDPTLAVWSRLADLLERQARLTTTSAGDMGYGMYREAQYVMAALADEIFLNADWAGREYWTTHLLESHFFNSNIAGDEVFRRVDKLLRDPERGYTDIYAIYLLALSLGFRGKYRGRDDRGRIDEIRQRLFIRVYHRKPQLLVDGRKLFANCYGHTLDLGEARKLPSPGRWFWGLGAAVLLWLAISTVVWRELTDDLQEDIAKIRSNATASAISGQ